MARFITLLATIFLFSSELWAGIGNVTRLQGTVNKVSTSKKKSKVLLGEEIEEGDVFHTQARSFVKVEMKDKTVVSIGPNSVFRFSKIKFDGDRDQIMDLLKGKMRAIISKKTKKDERVQFGSALIAVGVRGTEIMMNTYVIDGINTNDTLVLEGSVEYDATKIGGKKFMLYEGQFVNSNLIRKKDKEAVMNLSPRLVKTFREKPFSFLPNIQSPKGNYINLEDISREMMELPKYDPGAPEEQVSLEDDKTTLLPAKRSAHDILPGVHLGSMLQSLLFVGNCLRPGDASIFTNTTQLFIDMEMWNWDAYKESAAQTKSVMDIKDKQLKSFKAAELDIRSASQAVQNRSLNLQMLAMGYNTAAIVAIMNTMSGIKFDKNEADNCAGGFFSTEVSDEELKNNFAAIKDKIQIKKSLPTLMHAMDLDAQTTGAALRVSGPFRNLLDKYRNTGLGRAAIYSVLSEAAWSGHKLTTAAGNEYQSRVEKLGEVYNAMKAEFSKNGSLTSQMESDFDTRIQVDIIENDKNCTRGGNGVLLRDKSCSCYTTKNCKKAIYPKLEIDGYQIPKIVNDVVYLLKDIGTAHYRGNHKEARELQTKLSSLEAPLESFLVGLIPKFNRLVTQKNMKKFDFKERKTEIRTQLNSEYGQAYSPLSSQEKEILSAYLKIQPPNIQYSTKFKSWSVQHKNLNSPVKGKIKKTSSKSQKQMSAEDAEEKTPGEGIATKAAPLTKEVMQKEYSFGKQKKKEKKPSYDPTKE